MASIVKYIYIYICSDDLKLNVLIKDNLCICEDSSADFFSDHHTTIVDYMKTFKMADEI